MSRVAVEREGAVAHVRLTRGEKRNGLDLEMFEALASAGDALRSDSALRAVVLSGEGPAFCAGLDWKAFMSTAGASQKLLDRPADRPGNLAQEIAWVWQEVPVPVIAALHGPCYGGGLQLAMGADIRIAAPDTKLSIMEIEYGLIPDMGITRTLLPLLRLDVFKELMFTGRVVEADEALALGLVTRVVDDPLSEAKSLAETIASKSPHAIRAGKRLVDELELRDVRGAFELETELQMKLLGSANQMEAAMAKMQKRAARFKDPD